MAIKNYMNLPRNLHLLQNIPDTHMISHIFDIILLNSLILFHHCLFILSLEADLKVRLQKETQNRAVLYYTSCWDCVGMKFEIVGIDPNCLHPKPRPTTPQDLFKTSLFLYQKENFGNT